MGFDINLFFPAAEFDFQISIEQCFKNRERLQPNGRLKERNCFWTSLGNIEKRL
jgi:hypothetical protein